MEKRLTPLAWCAAATLLSIGCGDASAPPDATASVDGGVGAGADGAAADAAVPDLSMSDLAGADMTVATPPDLDAPADMATGGGNPFPPGFTFLDGTSGLAGPILDASLDEAGNLWAVSPGALFILRSGAGQFRGYTNADGLHIYSVITTVAGAGPNEGYVGLEGYEDDDPFDDTLAQEQAGKAEHVHLHADGTIDSLQYADLHSDVSANYYETRSARRLVYPHAGPCAGHLFMGGNHGITHILDDSWGDHVHVEVMYPDGSLALGEFLGIAVDPATSGLWTCGRRGCGLQKWDPDPKKWVMNPYLTAFTVFTNDHGLVVPAGYEERLVGAAVTPDGRAWFLSRLFGLAVWDKGAIADVTVPGLGTGVDVAADPDGTLWVADTGKVLRFDPATGTATAFAVPSGNVRRLTMDTQSQPRTLLISTGGGVGIYRGQ
jgi:hypothetical protein